jgi:hypothetical protein
MRGHWAIAGALVTLFSIAVLGSIGVGTLRSFDEDFCFTREDVPVGWTSYSSRWSDWPPGQRCIYRMEDGSTLTIPPPSEDVAPLIYVAGGLLLLYVTAYFTLGRADRSTKQGRLSAG